MFENFEQYVFGEIGFHGSIQKYINDISKQLFELKRTPNLTEIMQVNLKKVVPHRFYLIEYNYNGNKIWCPILALDYKVIENKNILYAVNLEYLPPLFKIKYFNLLFSRMKQELTKIVDVDKLVEEKSLPINFDLIYNTLKNNGKMNYAVTAYDYLKINKAYLVSAKISNKLIMCDMKKFNSESMKDLFNKLPSSKERDTLEDIIKIHDELIEEYQENSIEYHKKVASFEKHLKLIKT